MKDEIERRDRIRRTALIMSNDEQQTCRKMSSGRDKERIEKCDKEHNSMNILMILDSLIRGDISVEEAYNAISQQISHQYRTQGIRILEDFARIDTSRMQRTGIPEIILAEGKRAEHVAEIAISLASSQGFALVSRASEDVVQAIKSAVERARSDSSDRDSGRESSREGSRESDAENFEIEHNRTARTVLVKKHSYRFEKHGVIGIIAAGTADIRVAEEARVVAEVCGCKVITAYDVGIAGLHRLSSPLEQMLSEDVSAIIVVAGMEGALPSVVASLVDVPVIGVPTSIGYGLGGGGIAALLSMLQSCTPGLAVVNIDNGVAAGALAAKIVRTSTRLASERVRRESMREHEREHEREGMRTEVNGD